MKGIRFVVDGKGEKTAVVIDLKKRGLLLEDFEDVAAAESRAEGPREPLRSVKEKESAGGKPRE